MKFLSILITLLILSFQKQPLKHKLTFKTKNGHNIEVNRGNISFDGKNLNKLHDDIIIYDSKANRLVEDHGSVILFVAIDDRPNLEKMQAFIITPTKATKAVQAILSPVKVMTTMDS